MKNKILKNIFAAAIIVLLFAPVLSFAHQAHALDVGINEINSTIQLGSDDPRTIVARIINTAMLCLGIIAVVIILLGGFKWMTAGGNEEKTGEAKKLMGAGVIGLVIILAAWGIASFLLTQLMNATNNA